MKTNNLATFLLTALCCGSIAHGQTLEWTRQLGTSSIDRSWAVSADGLGNIYMAGETTGNLGETAAGNIDAFVAKYDASGALQWTRQLGTLDDDTAWGVSADGLGNVYITGETWGSLEGTSAGLNDAFLSKYDASGTLLWSRQFGISSYDFSFDVSADGLGNVFVAGTAGSDQGDNLSVFDAFVQKFDSSGTWQWTQRFGSLEYDASNGVSADGLGNVYVSGTIGFDTNPYSDAFLSKYGAGGALLWTRLISTDRIDGGSGVAVDGQGNVYVSGATGGDLAGDNAGSSDVFLIKYSPTGTLRWTRQFGTTSKDLSTGVSVDATGNTYLSMYTTGDLEGTNVGRNDAYLVKYDANGVRKWIRQLGTTLGDWGNGITADGLGSVYISGSTAGSLGGSNAGSEDAILVKFWTDLADLNADFDFDNDADGNDFLLWQSGFLTAGSIATKGDGDHDYDGDVDGDDLLGWQIEFGSDGSAAGIAVPEPAGLWLLAMGGFCLMLRNVGGGRQGTHQADLRVDISWELATLDSGPFDAYQRQQNAIGTTRLAVAATQVVAFLMFAFCCGLSAPAQTLEWIRQFGSIETDSANSISVDALGNVFITGYTMGNLEGINSGGNDVFLSKYNASGTLEWTRQFGDDQTDYGYGVAADGLGNAYMCGVFSHYGTDGFLRKYDASGTLLWEELISWNNPWGGSSSDIAKAVSVDGLGNVYISGDSTAHLGETYAGGMDVFLSKYTKSGTLQWTRQLGTSGVDYSNGVSADRLGNVYISGYSFQYPDPAGPVVDDRDLFLAKYDSVGELEWTRQISTSEFEGPSSGSVVSTDGLGNVYITGNSYGSLEGTSAGLNDAFLRKYDASGALQWTEQLGTSKGEFGKGVSADELGNVYLIGTTNGSLGGPNAGKFDTFLTKYNSSGALQWTRQLGTSELEPSQGISLDDLGNVYIAGRTNGSLGGPNAGSYDAFVAKFWTDLSEPAADFDLDGDVDSDDLSLWQNGFATACCTATKRDGDYDDNGIVDGSDFLGWQRQYGMGAAAPGVTIPELGSVILWLMALAGSLSRRRLT
jgi:beta-propeller repeat-containing protein